MDYLFTVGPLPRIMLNPSQAQADIITNENLPFAGLESEHHFTLLVALKILPVFSLILPMGE